MLRYLRFLIGMILALPILVIIALSLGLPITISGIGYLLGSVLTVAGLILFPWAGRKSISITILGITLIASVATVRLILVRQNPNPSIRMIALPQGKDTRWINTLIDEEDSLIVGEALFHRIGGDSPAEHNGITSALHTDYSQIRGTQRVFSSPFVSTYLNLQRATHFDAIIIQPKANYPPEFALVFLHGYMGNVTGQCWEIAQAIKNFDALTICPSTSWRGDWWQPQGQAILQSTFEYLGKQGIQKFYLSGFSNGGISIGRLASQLKDKEGLRGLILIDGFDNGAGIRELDLPVLILEGLQDERIPPALARPVATEIGDLGTYVEFYGDHFLIMKQPASVQKAIANWLRTQEPKQ
ncbi:MAG TPA: alpha/beta hydrolase [Anaerolineales bacterium]|nr:alpha/beta hydrolase [Anaerolineales bacterium]